MIWEEIIIDRSHAENEIVDTISRLFSILPSEVIVIDDITKNTIDKRFKVVCESRAVKGNFVVQISIYLRDKRLKSIANKTHIGQFCEILHCKCLVSDNSTNPYSRLLVKGINNQKTVFLDTIPLDEKEEFIILNET